MEPNSANPRRTLVIAADDARTRYILQQQLGTQWMLLLVADGHDALRYYDSYRSSIAAVIVDQNMLLLNGLALIEQVRSMDTATTIMLYTHGRASEVLQRWCEKYGVVIVPTPTAIAPLLDVCLSISGGAGAL